MGRRCLTVVLLTMGALVLVGCARGSGRTPTPVAVATETGVGTGPPSSGGTVAASGEIVPVQEVEPGFSVSGQVQGVMVAEGDNVQAGETLVTLDTEDLEADVARAEGAVAAAEAQLALLKADPRPGEVASAEAQLEAAEGALTETVARRDQLAAGAVEAEIAAAQGQLTAAEAEWIAARINHDQLKDREDIEDWEEEEALLRRRAAELARAAAEANLLQAEGHADVQMRAAQAAVLTAAAERDGARAHLAVVQAGAPLDQVAAAEAAVTEAEAGLEVARAALAQATLRAPLAGTIIRLEISPGETVKPGQGVLTLADLRRLRVETTDLSERDVDQVSVGQRATVYVEGLGVEVGGEVDDIALQADTIGGDVVYAVTIELDEQPSGLRWGMSVEVEIDAP